MSSLWRSVRCAWLETLLFTTAVAVFVVERNVGALLGGGLAAGIGVYMLWQGGELQLAWRAPRLDALGVRIESSQVAWATLLLGEEVLARFDTTPAYRTFFPELRRELRQVMQGVVDNPRDAPNFHAQLRRLLEHLDAWKEGATTPTTAFVRLADLEDRASALAEAVKEVRDLQPVGRSA